MCKFKTSQRLTFAAVKCFPFVARYSNGSLYALSEHCRFEAFLPLTTYAPSSAASPRSSHESLMMALQLLHNSTAGALLSARSIAGAPAAMSLADFAAASTVPRRWRELAYFR